MQEPVPKGITQPIMVVEQERKSQQAIAESTTKVGIPTKTEDVLPDPLHILEGIGELAYDTDRVIRGAAGGSSHVDTTKPQRALEIIKGRQKIGGRIVSILDKLGLKK